MFPHRPFRAAFILAVLIPAGAQSQAVSKPQFVQQAAVANQFEIQTSQTALERSQNAGVRAFAQQMIADHTKAGSDLQAVLSRDPSVPVPPTALDAPHQALLTQLQATPAGDFDRTYVQLQDTAHHEAVGLFKAYVQGGEPGPVHDFAAATLPVLQMHLQHVQALKSTAR
jgi:putative membrane protein